VIPKGITCAGPEDDGTRCLFQTCYDVTVAPIALTHSEIRSSRSETALRLTFTSQGRGIATLGLDDVRVHLSGEIHITHGLYLWLLRFLDCVTVEVGERSWRLSKDMVRPVGFEPTQGLLPYPPNAFNGYRVLQEYFSLPEKFLFLDVLGLGAALRDADPAQQEMTLSFSLTRPLDPRIRARNDHFRLFCTPAVNLFPHVADGSTIWSAQPDGSWANTPSIRSTVSRAGPLTGGDSGATRHLKALNTGSNGPGARKRPTTGCGCASRLRARAWTTTSASSTAAIWPFSRPAKQSPWT
jgi:type VI protein secretion system component VasA